MGILKIKGEAVYSPAVRVYLVLLLPIIAFVQFFFPYSLFLSAIIAVVLLFVGLTGFSLHYLYEYDVENNLYRKSKVTCGLCFGKWVEMKPQCNYIAFQMFNQNYDISFMNMYTTSTQEQIFVVRLVKNDGNYDTLVEVSDHQSVSKCLEFCELLSEKNNLPFKDFVKEQVMKLRRI